MNNLKEKVEILKEKIMYYIENINYKKIIVPALFIFSFTFNIVLVYMLIAYNIEQKEQKEIITEEKSEFKENIVLKEDENKLENEVKVEEFIYVDVKGSVKKPGVYKLQKGSRVIDAIKLAGEVTKEANTRFINMSKVLNDSDVIVVYSKSEIEASKKEEIIVNTPCICEEIKNDACYNEKEENEPKEEQKETIKTENKININTATQEELETLNGIGEAKAKAIIEYRNTNEFLSIEDILKVSGISQTLYEKIKDYITI